MDKLLKKLKKILSKLGIDEEKQEKVISMLDEEDEEPVEEVDNVVSEEPQADAPAVVEGEGETPSEEPAPVTRRVLRAETPATGAGIKNAGLFAKLTAEAKVTSLTYTDESGVASEAEVSGKEYKVEFINDSVVGGYAVHKMIVGNKWSWHKFAYSSKQNNFSSIEAACTIGSYTYAV